MERVADEGVRGSSVRFGDTYLCSSVVGMRLTGTYGSYAYACDACGVEVREVTDSRDGESVVLYRSGTRWYEWQGAPALDRVRSGHEFHPSGDRVARRERRLREAVDEDRLAGGVRDEVREQV